MIDLGVVLAFVPAVVLILLSPGPDTVYTVVQSLSNGPVAGIAAGLGTATGVLVHTAAAVLGLSALVRSSATAYTAVTYVGAAYLVSLGVRTIRADEAFAIRDREASGTLADAYRRAVLVNVSNPKVAVFVLAFLPQFVPATANVPLQTSILGVVYAALSLLYLGCVALFAGSVRHALLGSGLARRIVQYASGSVLVGFGLALVVETGRA